MIHWLTTHNVTHPLISAAVFVIIAFATGSGVLAAVVPLVFYYSREFSHAEKRADDNMRPWLYVLPWTWHQTEQWGFWPVVVVVAVLSILRGVL